MESKEGHDQDVLVDLEKGSCLLIREDSYGTDVKLISGQAKTLFNGSWNDLIAVKDDHHMPCCSSLSQDCVAKNGEDRTSDGDVKAGFFDNSMSDKDRKKRSKKPPRPPRPPSTPLDAADQKLINELTEITMLKRARIERMKALKKMKNSKPASSIGSLVAFIITVIFCLVILWQGLFSRHGASISFHGPPMSSFRSNGGGLISIQFYKKNETAISPHSSSAAANDTGMTMRPEIHGEAGKVTQ